MHVRYKSCYTIIAFLFLWCLACLPGVQAQSSQRVTLQAKNIAMRELLVEIEKQTDYYYMYWKEIEKQTKRMNIDVQDVPFQQLLDSCFTYQPVTYAIVDKCITIIRKKTPASRKGMKATTGSIINIHINHQPLAYRKMPPVQQPVVVFWHDVFDKPFLQQQRLNYQTFWAAMPVPAGEHPLAIAVSPENWQQQTTPDLRGRLENILKKFIPARMQSTMSNPLVIVDNDLFEGNFSRIDPEIVKSITILKRSGNSYTLGNDDILLIATSRHMPGYKHLWYGLVWMLLTFAVTIFGHYEKTTILFFSICFFLQKTIFRWRWKK